MSLGDSPDWTHTVGGAGALILASTANPGGNGLAPQIEYVGVWPTITLYGSTDVTAAQVWRFTIVWFYDAAMTFTVGSDVYEVDKGTASTFGVPVISPFFTVAFQPYVAADNIPVKYAVFGGNLPSSTIAGAVSPILVEDVAHSVASGALISLAPARVAEGVATFTIYSEGTAWNANVQRFDSAGASQGVFGTLNGDGSTSRTVRFGLPPSRMRIFVTNSDPTFTRKFWTTLTVDKQS